MTNSEFFQTNFTYIVETYKRFTKDPSSIDSSWVEFFSQLSENESEILKDATGASWNRESSAVIGTDAQRTSYLDIESESESAKKNVPPTSENRSENRTTKTTETHSKLHSLIEGYRNFGHISSRINPLNAQEIAPHTAINPETYDIAPNELESKTPFQIANFHGTTQEIINKLNLLYCNTIAAELSHIPNTEEKNWITNRYETAKSELDSNAKKQLLTTLNKAENFENFLHVKFQGTKRFSIEGAEATLIGLEAIILESSNQGTEEVIIGMAHRGRLNVLTHFVGREYRSMFSEFMGESSIPDSIKHSGDVKYHLGHSQVRKLKNNKDISISLIPNPSHLESVDSVIMGKTKAKQDLFHDGNQTKVLPITIHGDAAMSGQGVVYESIIMSTLQGYSAGGTVHITINNQIGFTAEKSETNGSLYSTDVAKSIQAPIFHINSTDIEGLVLISKIAAEYRVKFQKDIFIEIICYRKYGHNEGDEPLFTQPILYTQIKQLQTPNDLYATKLIKENIVTEEEYATLKSENRKFLESEFEEAKTFNRKEANWLKKEWKKIKPTNDEAELAKPVKTSITQKTFDIIGGQISSEPESFNLLSKTKKLLSERQRSLLNSKAIDWATAEQLAYGSILLENIPVRLSGEDSERGTFSHRHSVLHDQKSNKKYCALNFLTAKQAKFSVHNSPLSEFGVLGFEYGYSVVTPNQLTVWEAQFGDFSNGASVIYDQYISASEDKWLRMTGLVSLLPHGFEGQGSEHSSARLERFLQYCAKANIIVANCTTPANFFHIIRRQVKAPYRKPLIIMSPKSLLRHPKVLSEAKDFYEPNTFQTIIPDHNNNQETAKRVIVTSGKLYYEILQEVEASKLETKIAIIRIEQYYPFDSELFNSEIQKYKSATQFIWAQEEPKNMGAWHFIRDYLALSKKDFTCISRVPSPSPATGFAKIHAQEQSSIIKALTTFQS